MKIYINIFFLLLLLCACSDQRRNSKVNQWMTNNGKVKVLSTIAMIDEIVSQIGGEYVDSLVLIEGELDPHSYQLVKGDDEKFAYAQIIFYNGLSLEHGPSLKKHLSENKKTIPLGDRIFAQDSSLAVYERGQLDPHIWLDISIWAKTIPFIVKALSEQDSEHAELYEANGNQLIANMLKVHNHIQETMRAIPESKRFLVTSHDAFNYFTRAYLATEQESTKSQWKKRFTAPEGLAPESQLSVTDIQDVIDHLAKYQIHVLFPECNVSKDSIRKILQAGKEKGLDLVIAEDCLYGDSMNGETYVGMIQHNVNMMKNYWTEDHE